MINMIRLVFVTLTILTTLTISYCQSDYVVTLANDTIYGKIDNTDHRGDVKTTINFKFQNDEGKQKRKTYDAFDIKAFSLKGVFYHAKEINEGSEDPSNGWRYIKIFAKKIIEGDLSLYLLEYTSYSTSANFGLGGPIHFASDAKLYYFERKNERRMQPAAVSKKELTDYFKDCSAIVTKIKSKELTKKDAEQIVKIYNNECAANN